MRLKEFFACLALCVCLILPGFNAQAAGVTNYESFVSADYWVQNNPAGEQLILDAAGVKRPVLRPITNVLLINHLRFTI